MNDPIGGTTLDAHHRTFAGGGVAHPSTSPTAACQVAEFAVQRTGEECFTVIARLIACTEQCECAVPWSFISLTMRPLSSCHFVGTFPMYERPFRKPLRYSGHDYRAPCCVHVTICTHHRQSLFGTVSAAGMRLNDAGRFVDGALYELQSATDGISLDTHIVMPDHLHAIIVLGTHPHAGATASIPDLVRDFKTRVQKSWPAGIRHGGWEPYDTHLWQRSYYDTLIRDDTHLETTRAYILENPRRWMERMAP